jgi:hypothetical protein
VNRVLDVSATLAARVSVLGSGQSTKTGPNDARSGAGLQPWPRYALEDHVSVRRLLATRHADLAR